MSRIVGLLLLLGLVVAGAPGCAKKEDPKPQGVNITAPGINMKVGPDGVQIQGPGVDVKTNNQGGVNVNAPGVNVNVPTPNP